MMKIRVSLDSADEGRWSAVDTNGKVVADGSEGYSGGEQGAINGFEQFAEHIRSGNYEIVVEKRQ